MNLNSIIRAYTLLSGLFLSSLAIGADLIEVNIPEYRVRLYQINSERNISNKVGEWPCRIGKPQTKTPITEGIIVSKNPHPVFRYLHGRKKGQKIIWTNTRDEKTNKYVRRKMSSYKLRAFMPNWKFNNKLINSGQIFHTTTNWYTVNSACSSGCIGMTEQDMLSLYDNVEKGTPIKVDYDCCKYNSKESSITFFADVYNRNFDYKKDVQEIFDMLRISDSVDYNKLKTYFSKINKINKKIKKYSKPKKQSISFNLFDIFKTNSNFYKEHSLSDLTCDY